MNGQQPIDPRVAAAFGQTQEQKAAELVQVVGVVLADLGLDPRDPVVSASVLRSFERCARMGIVS